MNILLINTFYDPNMIGGAEHSVKLLAENLLHAGNNVAVFTMDGEAGSDVIRSKDKVNGVTVYRGTTRFFSKEKHIGRSDRLTHLLCRLTSVYNPTTGDQLDRVCADFHPDIVHTNNVYGISCTCWRFFRKQKIPVVHTIRDYFLLDPTARVGGTRGIVLKLYQAFLRGKSVRNVDIVTAPSRFTLDAFLNCGYFKKSRSQVVYNSVRIDEAETRSIIEEKRLRTDGEICFLFVGALNHNKGVDNLLEAFDRIDSENVRLVICGSGEMQDLVQERVARDQRIEYRGQLPFSEIKKAYIEADVLVAPSTWDEPFGRIVIEANQYGLPVIGSNKAGIRETIEHMGGGIAVNPDSVDEIRQTMEAMMDRKCYGKYYQAILKRIMDYSVERQIAEFMKIYQNN